MKRMVVALLAVLYLGMSSGMAMTIHFCRGKLAKVDFFSTQAPKKGCGKCIRKAAKKPPCCKDQYQFVKVEDAHKKAEIDAPLLPFVVALVQSFFLPPLESTNTAWLSTRLVADPSPPNRPDYSELYCVYRI